MRQVEEQGAPPSATSHGQMPRPTLSWLAIGGALLVFVLLARSLTAYPLKPLVLNLAGTTTPTSQSGTSAPASTTVLAAQDSGVHGLTMQYVTMASANDGWATGWIDATDGTGGQEQLLLHWDGSAWSRSVPPSTGLGPISSLPDGQVWMVSQWNILYYTGSAWITSYAGTPPDPNGTNYTTLASLDMISPFEGWAAGSINEAAGEQSIILHYFNGAWSRETIPSHPETNLLRSISVTADGRSGLAVGSLDTENGEISYGLRYAGGQWTEDSPGFPGGATAVSMAGPSDAWVVGITSGSGPGYIMHWLGRGWQQVQSPTPNQLHAITMLSHNEGWIAGDGAATLHYINGAWQQEGLVIHNTMLSSITMTAPGAGWTVGGAVILHAQGGVWSLYKLSL